MNMGQGANFPAYFTMNDLGRNSRHFKRGMWSELRIPRETALACFLSFFSLLFLVNLILMDNCFSLYYSVLRLAAALEIKINLNSFEIAR